MMPSRRATVAAVLGICASAVQVATMTRSMSPGDRPLPASALPPAAVAMSARLSSGPATRRLAMPTRLRIHSSEVSIVSESSSFVMTLAGWWPPDARMRAPARPWVSRIACFCLSVGWVRDCPGARYLLAAVRQEAQERLPGADRVAGLDQPLGGGGGGWGGGLVGAG